MGEAKCPSVQKSASLTVPLPASRCIVVPCRCSSTHSTQRRTAGGGVPRCPQAWGARSKPLEKSAGVGLRSVDRNNKATLPLTRPNRTIKSYAKDPTPRVVKLQYVDSSPGLPPGRVRRPAEIQGPRAYSYPSTTCGKASSLSGMDSDLEAFSHNPADGSVAALPGRTAAKTNYLNQRFLSY